MNQDQPYLKQCPEYRISEHYEVKEIYLAYANKSLFNSDTVNSLRKEHTVFLVPVYDADTTPIEDHIAYNACHYSIEDLDNMFDAEYPVPIEQIIVCMSDKVSDQRPSKISEEPFYCNIKATSPDEPSNCTTQCKECRLEVNPPLCLACGNPCCTCDPSYEAFQQEQYEEYYGLKQKVDDMEQLDRAVKRPPSEIRNSLPAYMLDKKPYITRAIFIKDDMSTFKYFREFLNNHEYVYAISKKQSGVARTAYLIGGDSSWTIDEYFMNFNHFFAIELNQDAKDRAEFMNAIGNKPPAIRQEDIPVHPLATDMAFALIICSCIFAALITGAISAYFWLPLGWFTLGIVVAMVLYTIWQSTYMDQHPSRLSSEEFHRRFNP